MQRGALDLPCLAHHQVEVDVVIDGRAHSGVVIQKLVGRYYSIDGVGRFEIGQELLQDLLFRLFPAAPPMKPMKPIEFNRNLSEFIGI